MKTFLFSTRLALLVLCSTAVLQKTNAQAPVRKSVSFNANNDGSQLTSISIPDHPALDITTALTLEAWIKPTAFSSEIWQNTIISKEYFAAWQWGATTGSGTGYSLRCGNGGQLEFHYGAGQSPEWHDFASASGVLTLNEWQHVAASFTQNGGVKLYRNGVEVPLFATGLSTYPILSNDQALTIGGHFEYLRNFMGSIDEVRVWNVARSAAEINAHQNSAICDAPASLVANYSFNEAGNTAINHANSGVGNGIFTTAGGGTITDNAEGKDMASSGAEIQLKGNNIAIASGDVTATTTDNTDFGTPNGTTPIVKTFYIQNPSNDVLIIQNIISDNTHFVVSNAPTTIAAGADAPFTVTFTSTGVAAQLATITLQNNDCDESNYTFRVQTTGASSIATNYAVQTIPGNCNALTHCVKVVRTDNSTEDIIGLNLTITYPSNHLIFNEGGVTCSNANVQLIANVTTPGVLKIAAYGVAFLPTDEFNICFNMVSNNIQGSLAMPITLEVKESFADRAPSMATTTNNNIIVSTTMFVETQFFYGSTYPLGNSNGAQTSITDCTNSGYNTVTDASGRVSIGAGKQIRITRTPASNVDAADGIISLDARMIARISALENSTEVQSLSPMAILAADVNQDQQISAGDATLALRTSVGLRPIQYIWADATTLSGAAYQKSSSFPSQGNGGLWAESVPNAPNCLQMESPSCGPLSAQIFGVRLGDAVITESNNSQFLRSPNEIIFDLNHAVRHANNTMTIPFRYSDMSIPLTGLDLDVTVGASQSFKILSINSLSGYSQEANLTDNRFRYAAFSNRGDTQAKFELLVQLLNHESPKCNDFVSRKALINGAGSTINCTTLSTGSEDPLQAQVRLTPNPVEQLLQIQTPMALEARIINAVGAVVRNLDLNAGDHSIAVSDLAKGIYLFQYGTTSIKFMKL